MLIDFQFTNYKSFKNTADLDLTATKVEEYPHHVVKIAGEKVLRTAVIYGANASGKSNVYSALRYMRYYVLHSFSFDGERSEAELINNLEKKGDYIPVQPFLFDNDSKKSDTTFEIWFTIPDDKKEYSYNYGFSINKGIVTEEWLNYKTKSGREYKSIFLRESGKKIEYSKIPESYQKNLNISLNKSTLIVSLGAKLKIEVFEKIFKWFGTILLLDFGNPFENTLLSLQMPSGLDKNPKVRKKVVAYINTFDTSISDFSVEKTKNSNGDEGFLIFSAHKSKDNDISLIPFSEESAGTQKMFTLYSPLQNVLEKGGVLFIDEFNDRLHPLLVRNFIQTFMDPERNSKNAQLIFTTHDVSQLSGKLFRRDEIWFTEKDEDNATSLYSLVDIRGENMEKIRNDADILNNYLRGKYGGIPKLEEIKILGEKS